MYSIGQPSIFAHSLKFSSFAPTTLAKHCIRFGYSARKKFSLSVRLTPFRVPCCVDGSQTHVQKLVANANANVRHLMHSFIHSFILSFFLEREENASHSFVHSFVVVRMSVGSVSTFMYTFYYTKEPDTDSSSSSPQIAF